jgi:lanthanide-dependent methanol dehydrogenase
MALCLCLCLGAGSALAQGPVLIPSFAGGDDGSWQMPARDYASTRYSQLAEIAATNVASLKVAFTFSMGITRGQEGVPLVVGNTMFVLSPFPHTLYALDLA